MAMVPVDETPPKTDVGEKAKLEMVGAVMVKLALLTDAPMVAFNVSTVLAVTGAVVILKATDFVFAGTVTEVG